MSPAVKGSKIMASPMRMNTAAADSAMGAGAEVAVSLTTVFECVSVCVRLDMHRLFIMGHCPAILLLLILGLNSKGNPVNSIMKLRGYWRLRYGSSDFSQEVSRS